MDSFEIILLSESRFLFMFIGKQTKTFTFSERAFNRAFQFDDGPKSMTPVKDQNRLVLESKKDNKI